VCVFDLLPGFLGNLRRAGFCSLAKVAKKAGEMYQKTTAVTTSGAQGLSLPLIAGKLTEFVSGLQTFYIVRIQEYDVSVGY